MVSVPVLFILTAHGLFQAPGTGNTVSVPSCTLVSVPYLALSQFANSVMALDSSIPGGPACLVHIGTVDLLRQTKRFTFLVTQWHSLRTCTNAITWFEFRSAER